MPLSDEYIQYMIDALEVFGDVTSRKMFGGAGLYHQGVMFALIADNELFFKVDDVNRPDYEALGLKPFKPFDDKPTTMSYYPVPEDVLEDREQLEIWARKAFEAALRGKAKKNKR